MILGVGIDAVDIIRFNDWKQFTKKKLGRIFSSEEINYCLSIPAKSAERFAIRFAIREAFYKAFTSAFPEKNIPFLTVCKQLALKKTKQEVPYLLVDWQSIMKNNKKVETGIQANFSCSHTKIIATAIVILQTGLY